MRKRLHFLLAVFYIAFASSIFPQDAMQKSLVSDKAPKRPQKIDARPFLERIDAQIKKEMAEAPPVLHKDAEEKAVAWNFTVGSTKTWYSSDLTKTGSASFYQVPSTCRAVGTHCYIFVEDALWGSKVTQAAVDSVRIDFDSKTPANASKGIYQTDVETFGNPPNVDSDDKIVILILDIKDGYSGSGGYVAGYFYSYHEQTTEAYAYSNKGEVFFLDANPLDLTQDWGIKEGMSTTAHEFQHMIHYNYHTSQETFFNEGCSMVAELLCGYGAREQGSYTNETNHYLLDWRDDDNVLTDYSRAFRFMAYYYDQFGLGALKLFVQSSYTGIAGLNNALSKVTPSTSIRFNDLFDNWLVANILDDQSVSPIWGYNTSGYAAGLAKAVGTLHANPNVSQTSVSVAKLGAQYLTYKSGKNLSIQFNSTSSSNIKVYAVKIGSEGSAVEEVPLGSPYTVPDYGTTYSEVNFVIRNNSQSSALSFDYSSTGEGNSVELKYDFNEPTGYLAVPAGDTVAVVFDAVADGRIDSIKVALRRTGSIYGGIWKTKSNFTGNSYRTPLGQKMASITATSNMTPPVYPYPIPYPNWATIDVSNLNLSSNESFTVAFGYQGAYDVENRVMSTTYPGQSSFHSWSYDGEKNNWYYYTADDANVSVYLIRAYVSFGTIGNEKVVELAPTEYNLAQNYPNPFNPSTTIKFAIPKGDNVIIDIYSITGQKVKTLVRDFYAPGTYEARWNGLSDDGKQVASGIYLYRIVSGGFVKTNKMMLLK